jgi:uncharacterized protein (TIGR01319 family)
VTATSAPLVRQRAVDCLRSGTSWRRGLLVDVGSTFTKLTVINPDGSCEAAARGATTVDTEVTLGLLDAVDQLPPDVQPPFDWALATSSAAGGLRIASVGLTERLSGQAGIFAALGSGGRMVARSAGYLTDDDLARIADSDPHLILLSGGIDGGNADCIVFNARRLAELPSRASIIVAGNARATDAVAAVLATSNRNATVVSNVFPAPARVEIDAARDAVRELFMRHIAQAKGLDGLLCLLETECEPTPLAVSRAVALLAEEAQVASLALVDLGGATTDVHSGGGSQHRVRPVDLAAPEIARTVEGDLGMRWGAPGSAAMVPDDRRADLERRTGIDLIDAAEARRIDPNRLAETEADRLIDDELAGAAVATAIERHCGHVVVRHQPWGDRHRVAGKDLRGCEVVLATGGMFGAGERSMSILRTALTRAATTSLAPRKPRLVLDSEYLTYAAGLVAGTDLELARRILRPLAPSRKQAT